MKIPVNLLNQPCLNALAHAMLPGVSEVFRGSTLDSSVRRTRWQELTGDAAIVGDILLTATNGTMPVLVDVVPIAEPAHIYIWFQHISKPQVLVVNTMQIVDYGWGRRGEVGIRGFVPVCKIPLALDLGDGVYLPSSDCKILGACGAEADKARHRCLVLQMFNSLEILPPVPA